MSDFWMGFARTAASVGAVVEVPLAVMKNSQLEVKVVFVRVHPTGPPATVVFLSLTRMANEFCSDDRANCGI
jgi:hypothetical protein